MELSELFENPTVLLIIPFLLLVLFFRRKEWRTLVPSLLAYKKAGGARKFFFVELPYWLILGLAVVSLVATANPQSQKFEEKTYAYGYRAGLTIDDSGSMAGAYIEAAKVAATSFVSRRPKDVFSFVPFGDTAILASGIKFTSDHALVITSLSNLTGGSGSTALGDGYLGELVFLLNDVIPVNPKTGKKEFGVEFDRLKASLASDRNSEDFPYQDEVRRRIGRIDGAFITAITDAENNAGVDPKVVVPYIASFGVPAFLVNVGTAQDKELVRELEKSGGGYFFAKSDKDIQTMIDKIDALKPVRIVKGSVPVRRSMRPLLVKIAAALLGGAIVFYAIGLRIK
ncbi:MAG: hypothetical protein WAP51_04590 [Candidatus Sungiibacteriota bacterium]